MGAEFEGRVAVVTGGTRGIGWRCAELLAQRGARVVACSNSAAEIAQARSRRVERIEVAELDVADESSVAALFEGEHLRDGLDILVNAAGIQRLGSVVDAPRESWDSVLAVNLTGTYLASRHAIPRMRLRGGGAIVNIASIHARATAGSRAAYVASKTGVVGLTRAMALDHAGEGIRVNVVLPGVIFTPMLTEAWALLRPDKTLDEMRALAGEATPVGRIGTVDDVAEMILYLCSARAGFVTGAEFVVDGGVLDRLALPVTRP